MKKYMKNLIFGLLAVALVFSFTRITEAQTTGLYANQASASVTSVVLNGAVNPMGRSTTAWFEYGTQSSLFQYGETNHVYVGSSNASYPISETITNLTPNTTYYFRMVADNGQHRTKGSIMSFVTGTNTNTNYNSYNNNNTYTNTNTNTTYTNTNSNYTNTTVQNTSGVASSNTTLRATFTNPTGGFAQGYFEYGQTQALGLSTAPKSIGTNYTSTFSTTINGLVPNTTYYYRAVVLQDGMTYRGDILNFYTGTTSATTTRYINRYTDVVRPAPVVSSVNSTYDYNNYNYGQTAGVSYSGVNTNYNTANAFLGSSFLPSNALEWLLLLILLVAIIFVARRISRPTTYVVKA